MDVRTTPRNPALELAAVGGVGLLLGVPLLLLGVLFWERADRAREVERELERQAGGSQIVHGPLLEVPWVRIRHHRTATTNGAVVETPQEDRGSVWVAPTGLRLDVEQRTRRLRRAIYEVPAQTSTLRIEARFDPVSLDPLPDGARALWKDARWRIGVPDLRGVLRAELHAAGKGASRPLIFEAAPDRAGGGANLSAPAGLSGAPGAIVVEGTLEVSGLRSLHFTPAGRATEVRLRSDWRHPSFDGAHLPHQRKVGSDGFTARWTISPFARGLPSSTLGPMSLGHQAFGVTLIDPTDGYAQVGRSLKYAFFFVGLVLCGFLVLELSSGVRVHPAQYGLLGMAQVSFYLLLLAFSEHVAIEAAYLVAGMGTTVLTGLYALWTFGRQAFAAGVFGGTALAYGFQYVLVRLEDHALLLGAVLAFAVLALTMRATRRVRWYQTDARLLPSRELA